MKPSVFSHNPCDSAFSDPKAPVLECHLQPVDTVVVVVDRFIQNILHGSRKNCILVRFPEVPLVTVISCFANLENGTKNIYGPTLIIQQNEFITFAGAYFFRLDAKKPSASLRISLARWVSLSSFSNSRIFRSFSSVGRILCLLPTKALLPCFFLVLRQLDKVK